MELYLNYANSPFNPFNINFVFINQEKMRQSL